MKECNSISRHSSPVDAVIVVVSGYFDPIHVGHLEYFQQAKLLGDKLVVIVNNDHQASLKKGKPFMKCEERCILIQALECVDEVVASIDMDRTVCKTLDSLSPTPDFFVNGGDQFNSIIPEKIICEEKNIKLVDGLGDKIQSSSWLLRDLNSSKK